MKLPHIGMLWIGGDLSFLEILCIQSFLDAGHQVHVFTYGDVNNIPEGADVLDASLILAGPPFLRSKQNNSLALHADRFRLRMLAEIPGLIWADTDAYCLRPWNPTSGHYYAYQAPNSVGAGVVALPKASKTLEALLEATEEEYFIPEWFPENRKLEMIAEREAGTPVHVSEMPWGVWGPTAVTYYLNKTGEIEHTLPEDVLYPVSFDQRGRMLWADVLSPEDFPEETTSIHFYSSRLRRMISRRHQGIAPEGSLIAKLLERHGLDSRDAPLPIEERAAPPAPAEPVKPAAPKVAAKTQKTKRADAKDEKFLAITCMKDEGAFIPEWIAFHKAIGFDHFLVYTNDCSDGTDLILERLSEMGHVTHRDNTRQEGQRASYQIRAFRKAYREPLFRAHDWAMIMDVDEFVNIHTGDKSIRDLVNAAPKDTDLISLTWRLFGYGGVEAFSNDFLTQSFTRAAPYHCPRPAQAWGFKSLFRTDAYERLGTHRPLIPNNGDWDAVNWVNGSGETMPERYRELTRGNWRSGPDSIGYELGQLNHYAVRSKESFLLKSLKGTVHGGIDRNRDYWDRMNRNEEEDTSVQSLIPAAQAIYDELLGDSKLAELHSAACDWHRERIKTALEIEEIREMYEDLN